MDWSKLFFSADGRIGRQSFWIGFLILLGVSVVLGWIPLLGTIISIALIWPWICLYSKRFHDMGRSGWFAVVPVVVPGILFTIAVISTLIGLFGSRFSESDYDPMSPAFWAGIGSGLIFLGLGFLCWVAGTLWAGLAESDPGPNRYGERPTLPVAGVGAPSHPPGA